MEDVSRLMPLRVRTVWISDVHLGLRGCSAEMRLDFLHRTGCETLCLVGDIVDVWNMKRGLCRPQAHDNVIRTILGKAKRGTHVVFVPGDHDEVFRDHIGTRLGNVEIVEGAIHETRDGSRLLVAHGDELGGMVTCHPWLARPGTHAYDWLLAGNRWRNLLRRRLGIGYWWLAGFLKHNVKNAVNYKGGFEEAVAREARRHGVQGVVCGHIHHAEIREIHGIICRNCSDWVESNTALDERHDGRVGLLRWSDVACRAAQGRMPRARRRQLPCRFAFPCGQE